MMRGTFSTFVCLAKHTKAIDIAIRCGNRDSVAVVHFVSNLHCSAI